MCPLLPIWISKNICKNTKPCEFTFVKNKELLALFLQQILRTWKMPECLKLKNIQSLNWIFLVLIKKKECNPYLLENDDRSCGVHFFFFIRTSKIQLRLWMFLGFRHSGIFNVLKICCKNKAKSSLFLTQVNSQGFVFLHIFFKIHTKSRGHK